MLCFNENCVCVCVCQAYTHWEGNKMLLLIRHAPVRIGPLTHSLETLFCGVSEWKEGSENNMNKTGKV
jgi:hypothetical protein